MTVSCDYETYSAWKEDVIYQVVVQSLPNKVKFKLKL